MAVFFSPRASPLQYFCISVVPSGATGWLRSGGAIDPEPRGRAGGRPRPRPRLPQNPLAVGSLWPLPPKVAPRPVRSATHHFGGKMGNYPRCAAKTAPTPRNIYKTPKKLHLIFFIVLLLKFIIAFTHLMVQRNFRKHSLFNNHLLFAPVSTLWISAASNVIQFSPGSSSGLALELTDGNTEVDPGSYVADPSPDQRHRGGEEEFTIFLDGGIYEYWIYFRLARTMQ